MNRFTLSHDSVTCRRSPKVSSTAFDAQPPDLPPVSLMDMGFAIICLLARHPRASYPVLVHRLASLLHASFRPRLAASVVSPLRFAITSRPSRCEEDLHLQAVEHARHTQKSPPDNPAGPHTMSGDLSPESLFPKAWLQSCSVSGSIECDHVFTSLHDHSIPLSMNTLANQHRIIMRKCRFHRDAGLHALRRTFLTEAGRTLRM